MTDNAVRVSQREALRCLADRAAAAGAVQAPFYAAAAAGHIALVCIEDIGAPWPAETVRATRRPTIVLLSGDPGWGEPTFGPSRWRCAKPLKAWAAAGIVHGAAGKLEHYREAVMLAQVFGRLAFIETTSSLARCWSTFLDPLPRTGYLPAEGAHPVAPLVRH